MTHDPAPGASSIIVPCWNQVAFTRQCISALLRHTRAPWELIVIDNGSADGTAAYLAEMRDTAPLPVTVISNTKNLGFPAAINQGLSCARGEYLVMLNNDVVVTDGWLEQLRALTAVTPQPGHASSNSKSGLQETRPYDGHDITVIDLAPAESSQSKLQNPESKIGLVGPMSNYATPPQLVGDVPYRNLADMECFARRWRDEHRGKWMRVPKLSGFCLLITRGVYEAVGGLDTRFGLGFFDDDDLAERARRAGFELAVARDLFVHHFGSRTFAGNGVDAERLLAENERRFIEKWGDTAPRGKKVALRAWSGVEVDPGGAPDVRGAVKSPMDEADGIRLEPGRHDSDRARVSLTMIVRDEQKNLPRCLASVRGLFDEIVVVDTGSRDRTVEIARSFGARVFHFGWIDDFAAARNVALEHATGDYAFWLDADDVLEPAERAKLEALLETLQPIARGNFSHEGTGTGLRSLSQSAVGRAFVVRCACDPEPGGSGGETVVDHIRLFPLLKGVRWTYKVHEQILPALNRARVPVEWSDVTVRHTGYSDRALRAKKLERDTRILLGELCERPSDPFVLFNLGMIAHERRQWIEALGYLNRSLAGSAPTDSITRKLYALIARVHESLGDSDEALRICGQGLAIDPEDAELWFRKGVAHRHRGEPAEAEAAWRRILTLRRPRKFASMDQGIYGHVTRRNLAVLAAERGDQAEAQRLWRAVLAERPGDRDALRNLNPEGV